MSKGTARSHNVRMESAIPLAFTASWASGLNPYLLVLMMGLLGRFADWEVPAGLERVDVLVIFSVAALIASPSLDIPTAAIAAAGGTVALLTHLAKATTRVAVNTSPEPASNILVSVAEDIAVAGVVLVAVVNPWVAASIALVLLVAGVAVALSLLRFARAGLRRLRSARAEGGRPRPAGP
jgi:hypothetical protein